MSHLTKQQLAELKLDLENEIKATCRRLEEKEHYGLRGSVRDNTSELSTIDNHPADIGSEMFERGKDFALNEHDELKLTRINGALDRMAEGTYGYCQTCGQPISLERLKAVPETAFCIEHSPQSFVSAGRPIEELFLAPPFGRTSLDEHEDQNGFDGEDAWQIVESYGTSDSPALAEDNEIDDYNDMEIEASEELDGFVEPYETFLATDIYGENVVFYRNGVYRKYMESTEHLDSEDSLGTGSNKY
ncbi:TraR/DksA family transcriptional regulator [Fontibacillus phaseoli]|uniref:TraR/DksA family transcriptional regulator n=1 Tax=Fontibacillus phaseoli TaxID=1416533 RepID=A0A369BQC7_9BACL|nr:TraR/DksA C4-type zinc finger protein [Fontibacillus phaseoli]RCX22848.1 TraR/DksA family transcriptional regulator [Fontibacillus phaseoli]